jgi:hypothetical protein
MTSALFAWIGLILGENATAAARVSEVGLASGTVKALRAGM